MLICHNTCFFTVHSITAEKQACLLTKTQPFYELPESVTDLYNVPEIPDQVSCACTESVEQLFKCNSIGG
jgi:hypothetical protein